MFIVSYKLNLNSKLNSNLKFKLIGWNSRSRYLCVCIIKTNGNYIYVFPVFRYTFLHLFFTDMVLHRGKVAQYMQHKSVYELHRSQREHPKNLIGTRALTAHSGLLLVHWPAGQNSRHKRLQCQQHVPGRMPRSESKWYMEHNR